MSDLRQRARDFYRDILSDPVTASETYLAEKFLLENPLPEHIPFGGSYHGRQGMLTYLSEINAAIEMGPLEFEEWVAGDGIVAARGREASIVRSTGRRYNMRFVHWLNFASDGRITAMREYNDTAEMAAAFDK